MLVEKPIIFSQSEVEGVMGKYYVSKKDTPVLKGYAQKGVRGEGKGGGEG